MELENSAIKRVGIQGRQDRILNELNDRGGEGYSSLRSVSQPSVVLPPVLEVHDQYESLATASDNCAEDHTLGFHAPAGVKRDKSFGRWKRLSHRGLMHMLQGSPSDTHKVGRRPPESFQGRGKKLKHRGTKMRVSTTDGNCPAYVTQSRSRKVRMEAA